MIKISASPDAEAALSETTRTEDVCMSQDGSRLGLVGFSEDKILLFAIKITRDAQKADAQISDFMEVSSDSFASPHGMAFLGRNHIVVCNRNGDVCLFRIPDLDGSVKQVHLDPVGVISGRGYLRAKVKSPGSVAAYELSENEYRIIVCNNQWHFVSSHKISLCESPSITNEGVLIEKALKIPDGGAVSPDHEWIAISNHVFGEVLIYENTSLLNRTTDPVAYLQGLVCPHGLTFDPSGNLWVVDGSSPYLNCYEKPVGGWSGNLVKPTRSVRILENGLFYRGRYDVREGGVKGLYIDPATEVAITTHKLGMLEFHDLRLLRTSTESADLDHLEDLRRLRDLDLVNKMSQIDSRKWTILMRFSEELMRVRRKLSYIRRCIAPRMDKIRLVRINLNSKESILDPAGPIVSLTTYSARISLVHLAIESIALGSLKPRKIILWISDPDLIKPLPPALQRLEERGLEIRLCDELGPHCKYYPYVENEAEFSEPLVTADDDIFYPKHWLESLVRAHEENPSVIHCFRVRRMALNRFHFEPYLFWDLGKDTEPSHLNFVTGVEGAIYPPEFLAALKERGRPFENCCPQNDDIWLTFVAFQEGFKVAQLKDTAGDFSILRGSQNVALFHRNGIHGGNQIQLDNTFSTEDLSRLFALQGKRIKRVST